MIHEEDGAETNDPDTANAKQGERASDREAASVVQEGLQLAFQLRVGRDMLSLLPLDRGYVGAIHAEAHGDIARGELPT